MKKYKFEGPFFNFMYKYILGLYIQVNTYSILKSYINMTYHYGIVQLVRYSSGMYSIFYNNYIYNYTYWYV
jgi:hypothetical protein